MTITTNVPEQMRRDFKSKTAQESKDKMAKLRERIAGYPQSNDKDNQNRDWVGNRPVPTPTLIWAASALRVFYHKIAA